jgi:hypothetical protein
MEPRGYQQVSVSAEEREFYKVQDDVVTLARSDGGIYQEMRTQVKSGRKAFHMLKNDPERLRAETKSDYRAYVTLLSARVNELLRESHFSSAMSNEWLVTALRELIAIDAALEEGVSVERLANGVQRLENQLYGRLYNVLKSRPTGVSPNSLDFAGKVMLATKLLVDPHRESGEMELKACGYCEKTLTLPYLEEVKAPHRTFCTKDCQAEWHHRSK